MGHVMPESKVKANSPRHSSDRSWTAPTPPLDGLIWPQDG